MTVKMRKWSPCSPPAASPATRKFLVSIKPLKLQGFPEQDAGGDDFEMPQKFIAMKVKWKGEPRLFPLMPPFQSKPKKEISGDKIVKKGPGPGIIVHWDEDDPWLENTCCLSVVSNHHDPKFGPWEIAISLLYGEMIDSKAKMAVIGRVFVNISEFASRMGNSVAEQKLPLNLQIEGFPQDAILTVLFNIVEIRDTPALMSVPRGGSTTCSQLKGSSDNEHKKNGKARRRSLSHDAESLDDELGKIDGKDAASNNLSTKSIRSLPAVSGVAQDSDKKEGWFSWSRRFSFKRARNKELNLDEKAESCSNEGKTDVGPQSTASSSGELFSDPASQMDDPTKPCSGSPGVWEEKELISRDGQARLKAPVFFASFDQRSDKAGGESACTALVAVISHWLHLNKDGMPSRSEFDNLIMRGSSEWRKLCEDASYVKEFPNKHFDLETVLRADVGPVSIAPNKSFVGFLGAETIESLKGFMPFDDIWNEISSNNAAPRIYIVSWNDHFFVLKVEEKAYYIIDTLGERLFEGCNRAFILRFDDGAIMQKHGVKDQAKSGSENVKEEKEGEDEEIICAGKECCREFIKRFLAAIPLKELQEEEKKRSVSYFSLHQRLQIEFNYSCSSSSPASSSLTPSPFSSTTTTAASSPLYK